MRVMQQREKMTRTLPCAGVCTTPQSLTVQGVPHQRGVWFGQHLKFLSGPDFTGLLKSGKVEFLKTIAKGIITGTVRTGKTQQLE